MKNYYFFVILLIFILFSCESENSSTEANDDNSPGNGNSYPEFLAFYEPEGENIMGEEKQLVLIQVQNGETNYSSFYDLYPYGDDFFRNSDFNENILAMGLHYDLYDDGSRGVYIDIENGEHTELPMVGPSQDSDYSYFLSSTSRVSENGMILYLSATNDRHYGDEYTPYLIRYNPEENTHKVAVSPESFVLNQPEKGDDTETGQINRNVYISPDGRYAYGMIEAYGVSGNIHWDYEILFSYDFENEEYTRIGEEGDADVKFYGMTRDGKNILYSNDGIKKIFNIATQATSEFNFTYGSIYPIETNDNGFCDTKTTGIYYYDCINRQEINVIHSYNTEHAHFSKSGDFLYFTLEGSDKYICRSKDLAEDTEWDTLGTVPKEFTDIKFLR